MSKRVMFVLNRKNFREQILKGGATKRMLQERLGADSKVGESRTRAHARVFKSMNSEAQNGSLSRRLGGI